MKQVMLFVSLCSILEDEAFIHSTRLICKVAQSIVSLNPFIYKMREVGLHLKHALNTPPKRKCANLLLKCNQIPESQNY